MKINTKFFGEVTINTDSILSFDEGLLGFEKHTEFALLELFEMEDFVALQSLKDQEIAFILLKPWRLFDNYNIQISDIDLADIQIEEEKQVALYNVVTIPESFNDATANLLAPVLINIDKKKGKQYVLKEDVYTTRHRIFPEEKV
jgi:flagellar assembly factor FliW